MWFLAQTATAGSMQRWLHDFIPFDALVTLVNALYPEFVGLAALLLIAGLVQRLNHEPPVFPLIALGILAACIGSTPMLLSLAEQGVAALVQDVVNLNPNLGWLVVNNATDASMGMNFDVPYQRIAAFIKGSFANQDKGGLFNPGASVNYGIRSFFIFVAGMFATVAVFCMEAMLVLQKLILILTRLLAPVFFGCLGLPSARGLGNVFFRSVIAVITWPLSWAFVHLGTMALIAHLQPPVWNASPGDLFAPVAGFAVTCVVMVAGTLLAPVAFTRMVMHGNNAAAGVVGGVAGSTGQHLTHAIQSLSLAVGAIAGGAAGGNAHGVEDGAKAGSMLGNALSAPVNAATHAAGEITEGRHPVPSSASRLAANEFVLGLKENV